MDLGAWLRSLDLGQYEAAFRENAIDGRPPGRLALAALSPRSGNPPAAESLFIQHKTALGDPTMNMGWQSLKGFIRLLVVTGALIPLLTPIGSVAQRQEAPVGHRQPSASDVSGAESAPGVGTNPELEKREQELDKKLRDICRGC
jgi:hypothetical protein